MLGFRLKHIGINCQSADEAEQTAGFFERLFGFAKDPRDVSFFAGTAIEAMNSKGRGTMGHIAIGANSVEGPEISGNAGLPIRRVHRKI